jgi:hypothetical protein
MPATRLPLPELLSRPATPLHLHWAGADTLTIEEFTGMIAFGDDFDEVADTLGDDSLALAHLQYFYYVTETLANYEKDVEHTRRIADRLFKKLQHDDIETTLARFINRKRWFPSQSRNFSLSLFDTMPVPPVPCTPPGHRHNPIDVDNATPLINFNTPIVIADVNDTWPVIAAKNGWDASWSPIPIDADNGWNTAWPPAPKPYRKIRCGHCKRRGHHRAQCT